MAAGLLRDERHLRLRGGFSRGVSRRDDFLVKRLFGWLAADSTTVFIRGAVLRAFPKSERLQPGSTRRHSPMWKAGFYRDGHPFRGNQELQRPGVARCPSEQSRIFHYGILYARMCFLWGSARILAAPLLIAGACCIFCRPYPHASFTYYSTSARGRHSPWCSGYSPPALQCTT